jgi:DNA modification methylase
MKTVVADRLASAAKSRLPVDGLTHEFYRYPARFSPEFARTAIKSFTEPGDLVLDPFMGSGTTLVESFSLGRSAIGTDINPLSVFIARSKTTLYPDRALAEIERWVEKLVPTLSVDRRTNRHQGWMKDGYQNNINDHETWRIRKVIEMGLNALPQLPSERHRNFARCVILKTAQWALDCRESIPSTAEFRSRLLQNCKVLVLGARAFQIAVRSAAQKSEKAGRTFVQCLHRSAVGLDHDKCMSGKVAPKLILTSPPYPGVHVLYHRWQVRGRRETPAPYWIANKLDGNGASYYTFGDRQQKELRTYYATLRSAFTSLARIADRDTILVQMVSFSDTSSQLERYLEVMEEVGFSEYIQTHTSASKDGRLWREVPNRKWYASLKGSISSNKEVVLIHKLARHDS